MYLRHLCRPDLRAHLQNLHPPLDRSSAARGSASHLGLALDLGRPSWLCQSLGTLIPIVKTSQSIGGKIN